MSAETSRRWNPIRARRYALIALVLISLVGMGLQLAGSQMSPTAPAISLQLDPNTAPGAVLEALPRIGPAIAGRIIGAREDSPFVDLGDFDRRVRGIGPVTVAALRPYLRFEDGTGSHPKDR